MTTQGIAASREQTVERREQSIRRGTYVRPPVDVFETDDALVLVADVPGVAPDGIEVAVNGDRLTIEGRVRPGEFENLKPLYVESGVGGYHRQFTLGRKIDRDGIEAQLKNGVLVLTLPKAEHARLRRIEVKAA